VPGYRGGVRSVGLALALILLFAVACSGSEPAPDLVIGAIYPLSGPQGPGGQEELAGVQTAFQLAREDGLFGGRRVDLRIADARNPGQASAAVDRLVGQDRAPIVMGTYASTLAEPAAAQADARAAVYWETGAVSEGVTQNRRYVFRTVASGRTLGRIAVDFTGQVLIPRQRLQPGQARAVIVYVDDVYGRSVADGEAALAAEVGIPVVDRIAYDPRAFDPSALAERVATDRADYLWDVSYVDDGIAIWRQLLAHRVRLLAAVGTSSAFCMPDFGRRLGGDAVGVYAADKPDQSVNPSALTPEARALLGRAQKLYGAGHRGEAMTIPVVAGFVGAWTLLHDVLPRVKGKVTADSIRDAAYEVDLPAGSTISGGGVKFAPAGSADAGQNLRAVAVVGQWQAVGQMKVVYPQAFAMAAPRI
jgi:branched-chain amino acid transport system substrate-binding protein